MKTILHKLDQTHARTVTAVTHKFIKAQTWRQHAGCQFHWARSVCLRVCVRRVRISQSGRYV